METNKYGIRGERRLPSLRSLLIVLVAATIVPIFLFSAWLIVLQSQRERDVLEDSLLRTAQTVATDVDREVAATIQSLQTLALGLDVENVNAPEFQSFSNRLLSSQHNWKTVIVRDRSGKPLATISRQPEILAGSAVDPALDIFKREKDVGLDLPLAFLLGTTVGIHVPIQVDKQDSYFASVLVDPQAFAALLKKHKVSPDWLVSILDAKKVVVASTRFMEKLFGKPTQLFRTDSNQPGPGHLFHSKIENEPAYVVLSTAPVSRWSVALAVPASEVEAPYYRTLWLISGIGLLCLIAGITLAYLIGRKVARPIEQLADHAQQWAFGRAANPHRETLAEVSKIHEAFDQSAELLREREHERDFFSEQLDGRLYDLTELHKLTTGLLAIEERQALFDEIVTGVLTLLKAERGSLHVSDHETSRVNLAAQIGFHSEVFENEHFPGDSFADTVRTTRRPVIVEDVALTSILTEPQREAARETEIGAVASFPLIERGGNVLGALTAYFIRPFKPSPWQSILIDLYAQYCANVIQQIHAKEDLRNRNNGLEERVKEHAAKLEQAYFQRLQDLTKQRELEKGLREAQKMELVGTLAGGVAHDFNNILNIILSYAVSLNTKDEADLGEKVQVITETVQRGASVVKQLLAVAQKSEPKFEPADLNRLVRRLIDLLTQTFPKEISISLEDDPKIPSVMLDSNQISQAIINLCLNARDAMPNGGRLTIQTQYWEASEAKRRFAGANEGDYGCISVSDTGVGIPDEAKEHLFEPFFTTKGPGRGTGLGLSVVYGIMQSHGGFVHFDSAQGTGATFYLCFPIRKAASTVIGEGQSVDLNPIEDHRGGSILIVEDEQRQLDLLRRAFEKEGYKVLTAPGGDLALGLFDLYHSEIDVVLMDFGLPGMNGWEVFQKMKEIDPRVKVVFATGYMLPEFDLGKVEKESCGVVMKPYRMSEIVKTIAATISIETTRV